MPHFDAIVLGLGGVGSAALYHVARRGRRVLGIDRFPGGHDRGSSHGETRIIRQAYFEHADYVPLLLRAYELWHELEHECGETLLNPVGLLQVGLPEGHVVRGVLEAARIHGLAVDSYSSAETVKRFPGVAVPPAYVSVFERAAGYLRVERCVLAHLAAAQAAGAEALHDAEIQSWSASPIGVVVKTKDAQYTADRLIIAAGAWSSGMLTSVGIPLRVLRKHIYWYADSDPTYRQANGFPTFLFELPHGVFYGFPEIDGLGVKVGEHSGGSEVADPLNDPRLLDEQDETRVRNFLATCLPGVGTRRTRHSVCFYTMSPDENFLVDYHPASERVVFAAGLSGHGFKFTSVLGEALVDLALQGGTRLPIDFLSLRRFAA